jgi:hypothetical protein
VKSGTIRFLSCPGGRVRWRSGSFAILNFYTPKKGKHRTGSAARLVNIPIGLAGRWRSGSLPFAGARRRRLARRGEDEATLRDAVLLRHGGDDTGPAGRLLVA